MNRKERKHTNYCSENEEGKPKIGLYIVRKCAENIPQKVKWDIPNGVLGYEKRGFRHRNKGEEVEFWGVEGREMGYIGLVTRPKLGETGGKNNPFLQFSGHKNSIIFRYKTWNKHTQNL